MARPLRIEFDGVLYYVTSRGNAREPLFITDTNRVLFLDKKTASVARLKTPFTLPMKFVFVSIGYAIARLNCGVQVANLNPL